MGLIDAVRRRLMFWRKKTVAGDLDVNGCFTLPGTGVDGPASGPAATADVDVCAVDPATDVTAP